MPAVLPAVSSTMRAPTFNRSLNLTSPGNTSEFVILYQAEFLATIQVLAPLWPVIIVFGFTSNIINIIVFLKSGANDNVGVLLISLAASDLIFLALITPTACGYFMVAFVTSYPWPFDVRIVLNLLYWWAYTAYDLSSYIAVSLGVMRCACVAMPLKFKLIFTKSKTILWVFFLVILVVSLRMPVLTIHSIGWEADSSTNMSKPILLSRNYVAMSQINDILNRGIVIYLAYTTMIICVCVLSLKLYQAAQMRRSCSTGGSDTSVTKTMSTKDLQVVKSVVLVCTIFIVAQLPFLLSSTIRLMVPEFNSSKRLSRLFGIFSQISATCSYLNASINIFVYYYYNSKYRASLKAMCCAKIEEKRFASKVCNIDR